MKSLAERYAPQLAVVRQIMLQELSEWQWGGAGKALRIVRAQVQHTGKRLRPLLALASAGLFGGDPWRVCAPAASVEFYHLASLVLDDVQDNSEVRRGTATVHMTSGTSTAINVSGIIRSFAYHPIHRCGDLSVEEKLRLHAELDEAATHIVMGQSIDIGWHEGWYPSYAHFPYHQMIKWKTGSLFGCAAAAGACVAGAGPAETEMAKRIGVSFGMLYQQLNDYLDVFATDGELQRPAFEDFREGKITAPAISLFTALEAAGRGDEAKRIACTLADGAGPGGWEWLLATMHEYEVAAAVRREILGQAADLGREVSTLSGSGQDSGIHDLIDYAVARLGSAKGTEPSSAPTFSR
jgi:octaprenyl-diphosphate synthase